MSNYNSESGTLRTTKNGYPKVAQGLRNAHNDYYNEVYQEALKFYNSANKPKSYDELCSAVDKIYTRNTRYGYLEFNCPVDEEELVDFIYKEIYRNDYSKGSHKLTKKLKPRKNQVPHIKRTEKSFSIEVGRMGACLSITEPEPPFSGGTVEWNVPENNKAVDVTCKSKLYGKLFGFLVNHQWRKGEGGVIDYCSEFMDDQPDCDSEIREVFGPAGEAEVRRRNDALRAQFV